jgi:hypothetical protein
MLIFPVERGKFTFPATTSLGNGRVSLWMRRIENNFLKNALNKMDNVQTV